MSTFSLGKPTTIGGEEVIIVRDVLGLGSSQLVSESLAMVEPKAPDGRPAIYVSESDLARLREDYPGIKVYGLWQVLFYNKAVKLGSPLITFQLKDRRGLYLLVDSGLDLHDPASITKSGEYLDGYIPDNYDVDMSNASVIDADFASLRLPKQPAYTRIELSDKLKAENKRRWYVVGSLCGLIVVGAAATNYGLQTIYKSRMTDYSTKKTLITELDNRVRSLSVERLVTRPDDSVMLTQLYRAFEYYPAAMTPPPTEDLKVGFTGTHILITPPKVTVDPSVVIAGAEAVLQPDLSYKVVLTEPEGSDSSTTQEGFQ